MNGVPTDVMSIGLNFLLENCARIFLRACEKCSNFAGKNHTDIMQASCRNGVGIMSKSC